MISPFDDAVPVGTLGRADIAGNVRIRALETDETSHLPSSLTAGFLADPVTFSVVFDFRDTAKND